MIFLFCLYELYFKSKWESAERNVSRCPILKNNTGMFMLFQNEPTSLFFRFFKILYHPQSLITYNRDYYKWFCRLMYHIQTCRLPDQGTWLGLLTQSVIRGSMWSTAQTNNNSRINRWWRCALPCGPSLALPKQLTRRPLSIIG